MATKQQAFDMVNQEYPNYLESLDPDWASFILPYRPELTDFTVTEIRQETESTRATVRVAVMLDKGERVESAGEYVCTVQPGGWSATKMSFPDLPASVRKQIEVAAEYLIEEVLPDLIGKPEGFGTIEEWDQLTEN